MVEKRENMSMRAAGLCLELMAAIQRRLAVIDVAALGTPDEIKFLNEWKGEGND